MNKYNPSIRKSTLATVTSTLAGQELTGMTQGQVVAECQWKVTSGKGTERAATGSTFLNLLTPKVFVADSNDQLHPIPAVYANFDNLEGSVAVALAESLSTKLLETGEVPQLQYFFKLIDSKTKQTIATDMPERVSAEEDVSDLPDFLKPALTSVITDPYVPDAKICAFLHIYVERDGQPVRIASQDITARFAPQIAVAKKLADAGHHMQAGVVPQTKVVNWLESQANNALDGVDFGLEANS